MQDGQRGQGGGGEAHRVQDVRLNRGGEGRVDQEHPVSTKLSIFLGFFSHFLLSFLDTFCRQSISHNPFYDMLAVRKKKVQTPTSASN